MNVVIWFSGFSAGLLIALIAVGLQGDRADTYRRELESRAGQSAEIVKGKVIYKERRGARMPEEGK